MSAHPPSSRPVWQASRRGILRGGLALVAAALVSGRGRPAVAGAAGGHRFLTQHDAAMLRAVVPAVLGPALPVAGRAATLDRLVARIDGLIAAQPRVAKVELRRLFRLLTFAPTRALVAGVWSPWDEASADEVAGFLARWRDGRFADLRRGYLALVEMAGAAWYGMPEAWPHAGYPGPPEVARPAGTEPA